MPKVVLLYFDETQNENVNENLLIHPKLDLRTFVVKPLLVLKSCGPYIEFWVYVILSMKLRRVILVVLLLET